MGRLNIAELSKQKPVFVGGAAVVAAGLFFLLYGPLLGKINTHRAECLKLEAETTQAREKALKARGGEKQGKILVTEGAFSHVMEELTKRGNVERVNFISLTPGQAEQSSGSPYRLLPVKMETESSYEALGKFLGALDQMENGLVTLEALDVESNENESLKLKATLTVYLYLANGT